MKKYKTLFLTGRGERHQQAALGAAPPELDVVMLRDASKKEIIALLSEMDFLISERTGVIDAEIIASGKNLKLIQRLGSQTWDIDTAAAKKAGIPVCFLPVKTCGFVAEHLILMMLGLAKRVRELVAITDRAGDWGMPPKRCNENYFAFNWSGRAKVDALNQSTVGIFRIWRDRHRTCAPSQRLQLPDFVFQAASVTAVGRSGAWPNARAARCFSPSKRFCSLPVAEPAREQSKYQLGFLRWHEEGGAFCALRGAGCRQ